MATYLVQLLTGDYEVLDGGAAGDDAARPTSRSRDDVERMQPYFDLTDDQIAFFEPLFGPYPLDRTGWRSPTASPGWRWRPRAGRCSPGTTSPATLDHDRPAVPRPRAGPPVVRRRRDARRLVRPLAQRVVRHLRAVAVARPRRLSRARVGDDANARRPGRSRPSRRASRRVGNLFGFERYDGGAVVLHALRREIGDDAFFTLLQRWVADNDGTSRTTEDFIALAERGRRPRPRRRSSPTWLVRRRPCRPTYPG